MVCFEPEKSSAVPTENEPVAAPFQLSGGYLHGRVTTPTFSDPQSPNIEGRSFDRYDRVHCGPAEVTKKSTQNQFSTQVVSKWPTGAGMMTTCLPPPDASRRISSGSPDFHLYGRVPTQKRQLPSNSLPFGYSVGRMLES